MLEGDSSTQFSPSKLDVYKDCPRRYRFRYIEKIRRPGRSIEAFLGECVHAAFEKLYESLQHGRKLSQDEALAAFEEHWARGFGDDIKLRGDYGVADWKSLGRTCVERYYAAHAPFDEDTTVAVERKIGFSLPVEGRPIRIEGFIDRLALGKDGAFEIHDYKTGKTLPAQAEVDADWQLALYDAAVRATWPDAKGVRLIWHYVRHGKSLISTRTAEQLEGLKAEVAALISRIKRDRDFPVNKTVLCDWCEYRDLCPAWAHPEKIAALPPPQRLADEGFRLATRLGRLEDERRELKDRLKELELAVKAAEAEVAAWAQAAGVCAVQGQGGQASVSFKDELKLPAKTHAPQQWEAMEREARADAKLWEAVSHLDAHRVLEAFRERKLEERLLAAVDSIVTRFGRRSREATVRWHRDRGGEQD